MEICSGWGVAETEMGMNHVDKRIGSHELTTKKAYHVYHSQQTRRFLNCILQIERQQLDMKFAEKVKMFFGVILPK